MAEAREILCEQTAMMHARMLEMGGPDYDVEIHRRAFWDKFDRVLPPHGSYYLAVDDAGVVVGTGALRSVRAGVAEMKHLFVAERMRRSGLGRALVMARLADAQEMGIRTVIADTFVCNHEMRALYGDIGFAEVPPFAESATADLSPDLREFMAFYRYDMPSVGATE
ncbi:MAG: GNAT family N-acetyltransferase [Pseudomonadota bacterium]